MTVLQAGQVGVGSDYRPPSISISRRPSSVCLFVCLLAVVAGRSGAGSHYRSFSSANCRPFGAGTMMEQDAVSEADGGRENCLTEGRKAAKEGVSRDEVCFSEMR